MGVARENVGRIAERIAMNEFEARGYHVIDLAYVSKTYANVDFIVSRSGASFNVQVKGMTNPAKARWSVQYGYCDANIIRGQQLVFNTRPDAALNADVIVLLAVRSPSNYRAIVMDVATAEKAAQMNLSEYYREPKLDGGVRKPGKVWIELDAPSKPRKDHTAKDRERALLLQHENAWDL